MLIPKSQKAPHPLNMTKFMRTLYFISYVTLKTLAYNEKSKCNITYFTKICTNCLIDWKENIKSVFNPFGEWTPNPYGMVSYLITPYVLKSTPRKRYENRIFVYNLDLFARKIWIKKNRQDSNRKDIEFLVNEKELLEILKCEIEQDGNLYVNPKMVRSFDQIEIGRIDSLALIYEHLSTLELNMLASHRDAKKSRKCLEYVFRSWSTEVEKLIIFLESELSNIRNLDKNIERIVSSSNQINTKIDYIWNGIPDFTRKMEEKIKDKITDRMARNILDVILDKIHRNAPFRSNKKYETFRAQIKGYCRLNLEKMVPLTKALLFLCEDFHSDFHSFSFKSPIPAISGLDVTELEIKPNIKKIRRIFEELRRKERSLLRPERGQISWTI